MSWTPKTVPLTKYTDFVGEIRIAGLTPSTYNGETLVKQNFSGDANIAELVRLITKYEKRILTKLLTAPVYDQFVTAMTGSAAPETKWSDLYDKLYVENGPAIVANYVYYFHQRDVVTVGGTVGEVKPNQENSVNDTPAVKMCRAWNENWELICDFDKWYDSQQSVYLFDRSAEIQSMNDYGYLFEFQRINTYSL
jgi:hypothetical protein